MADEPQDEIQQTPQAESTAEASADAQASAPATYDEWLAAQDEATKALIESNTKGLKSALESERTSRKSLEKDVRELAGKAEKGSEAERQLTEMADRIKSADAKTDFYEAAHGRGITNLRLAWMVTQQDQLYDRRGNPDFEALKSGYPELFAKPLTPQGNAGSGTGTQPTPKKTMNDFIRARAGL